jgi:putative peptide zinc metalloprotease protein
MAGELRDSAFKDRQWLIQRRGRYIQVSEPVYRIAEYSNGQRTLGDIAELVSRSTDWELTDKQVAQIVVTKLIPLGIVAPSPELDSPKPAGGRMAPSPLALNMRMVVLGRRLIDPITGVLQFLFAPAILVPALIAVAAAHAWLYGFHGLAAPIRDVIYTPGALVAVVGLYVASGIFHELGHASGLRYGGGRARAIGVGIYLIYPALYTDTTDSYRLGRWGRVRTDLGGFYFHVLFALGIIEAYFISEQEWLLLTVLIINIDIVRQLFPLVRFDGYWVLTDLLGVPDILSHMKSTLTGRLAVPGGTGTAPQLKRWAAALFATYTLITVPVLAALLGMLLWRGPLILSAIWTALLIGADDLARAWAGGHLLASLAGAAQLGLLAIQAIGLIYILYAVFYQALRGLWRWSGPLPVRRVATTSISGAGIALLAYYWISNLGLGHGGAPEGVRTYDVGTRAHVEGPVTYAESPPVGGPHSRLWQNCGFYSTPIASEHAVHSMEHGAVWITYRPDLSASQVAALRVLADKKSYVLVSPDPALPAPVVASAWGRQLRLTSSDDPRLDQFVRLFRSGLQAPEHGGPCTGGIGSPMG